MPLERGDEEEEGGGGGGEGGGGGGGRRREERIIFKDIRFYTASVFPGFRRVRAPGLPGWPFRGRFDKFGFFLDGWSRNFGEFIK